MDEPANKTWKGCFNERSNLEVNNTNGMEEMWGDTAPRSLPGSRTAISYLDSGP